MAGRWTCVLLGQDWFRPVPVAAADRWCGGAAMVTGQLALSFAGLLRRLRAGARLTQEELAAAAGVSARSVSNLERGINRTAHKDTAVLLARALGLTGPAAELFVAAARGNVPAAQVLAAAEAAGPRPGAVTGSPYRGLAAFGEQDAGCFFGREAAAAALLDRMSRLLAGGGPPGGVGGVGRGEVVFAAGGGAAADPAELACRKRRRGRVCCSPRPGRRWMSWRCGWPCWRGRTRRRCGGGWRPIRPGSRSPPAKLPWHGH